MRDYLLRVSRELYTYNYPVVFDLATQTKIRTYGIPDKVDWFDGYGDQDGVDDAAFRRVEDGMATIGEGGCALIVLKGHRVVQRRIHGESFVPILVAVPDCVIFCIRGTVTVLS